MDLAIFDQLATFFGGFADIFDGLFSALGVIFKWAGIDAGE